MDSKEIVDNIDSLLTKGPADNIYCFERAKKVYLAISDSASSINKASYGEFFGCVQSSMINEMILNASKMFDMSKRYEMRTFPNILDYLNANSKVIPVAVEHFLHMKQLDGEKKEFVVTRDGDKATGGYVWEGLPESPMVAPDVISKLVDEIRAGMPELSKCKTGHTLSDYYALLRDMRDKEIAHNEHVIEVQRPTLEMAEELIDWAKAALEAISRCCIPELTYFCDDGRFMQTTDAGRPKRCLERMLRDLGVLPQYEWMSD